MGIEKYTKKERRNIRIFNQAFERYQELGSKMDESLWNTETGQYLLDRWSLRAEQAARQIERTITEDFDTSD